MNYHVPETYAINLGSKDNTTQWKKFTVKTFNGYAKQEATQALHDCLAKGLLVEANHWAAEWLASGWLLPLWDQLFAFYFQWIHCFNPNLLDYLNQQYVLFMQLKKTYAGQVHQLCNNQELRNHLAEIISLFCLADKHMLILETDHKSTNITHDWIIKIHQVVDKIAPYLHPDSNLHQRLTNFIVDYYHCVDQCLDDLDWFVKDQQHTIHPIKELKVSVSMDKKCVWLIWKFLWLNLRLNGQLYAEQIDGLVQLYVTLYQRKQYQTCVYLIFFAVRLTRQPEKFLWSKKIDVTAAEVIQQCAQINLIYQGLQNTYNKMQDPPQHTTTKRKSKSQKQAGSSKIMEFIQLINDFSIILDPNNRRVPNMPENNSTSDQIMVICLNGHSDSSDIITEN